MTDKLHIALAAEFSRRLRAELSASQWAEMVRLNKTPDYQCGACASHNYCDSNEVMAEAFEAFMGREIDCGSQDDVDLINAAWNAACAIWER